MTRTIPHDLVIPVAPEAGIGAGVPLADLGGVIAVSSQLGRPERTLRRIVFAAGIFALHAHRFRSVLVEPGEHGDARGHAPGADVGMGETHAPRREPVEIRRFREGIGVLVTREGAIRVIVGVEEEEIRPRGLVFRGPRGDHDEERQEEAKTKGAHGNEAGISLRFTAPTRDCHAFGG